MLPSVKQNWQGCHCLYDRFSVLSPSPICFYLPNVWKNGVTSRTTIPVWKLSYRRHKEVRDKIEYVLTHLSNLGQLVIIKKMFKHRMLKINPFKTWSEAHWKRVNRIFIIDFNRLWIRQLTLMWVVSFSFDFLASYPRYLFL